MGTSSPSLLSPSEGSVEPIMLSAQDAARAIRDGRLTAMAIVDACLARIEAREPDVRAWSFLDADLAREGARQADARQAAGLPLGPLHGLPIGVKDVFDTSDMPTEYGSGTLRGRRPQADASAVALLRQAGAVIIGKTITSEFGMYHPTPTRNPVDLTRSPGVSSAGSAAAVVDHMVPLALATQHTASTTLPASFCGAFAFKPSLGFTSMTGSNILVPRMSHVGFLARSIGDLGLFASVFDPTLGEISNPNRPPRLVLARGPGWDITSEDARGALSELLLKLPEPVPDFVLPPEFDDALEVTMGLLNAHLAHRFGALQEDIFATLCRPLQDGVAAGKAMSAVRYLGLDALADRMVALTHGLFKECDALISLSTPGEATRLEDGPGSGVMSMPWSLCGLPTVSLPLLRGAHDLPIGVQLIGAKGCDRKLLQIASWLVRVSEEATR